MCCVCLGAHQGSYSHETSQLGESQSRLIGPNAFSHAQLHIKMVSCLRRPTLLAICYAIFSLKSENLAHI